MRELTPRVPTELAQLDKAIMLLGNRLKTDLGKKARLKMIELIDAYPDPKTAAHWKLELKAIRQELVGESEPERSPPGKGEATC